MAINQEEALTVIDNLIEETEVVASLEVDPASSGAAREIGVPLLRLARKRLADLAPACCTVAEPESKPKTPKAKKEEPTSD